MLVLMAMAIYYIISFLDRLFHRFSDRFWMGVREYRNNDNVEVNDSDELDTNVARSSI